MARNEHIIKLSKEIWHYLLNHNIFITAEYLLSVLPVAGWKSRKKNRLFRVVSSSQSFLSGFPTTSFSYNRSICFPLMPSTTSIYILATRSLQSRDRYNDKKNRKTGRKIGLPYAFPPFSMILRVLLKKNKNVSSPDYDCTSLEYPTIVPRTLKPLCQEASAAPPGKKILIIPKNIVELLIVENSLALAAYLVSRKPFCVKDFHIMLLTNSTN